MGLPTGLSSCPQGQDDSGVAAEARSRFYQLRGLLLGDSRPQPTELKTVGSFGGHGLPKATQQRGKSEKIPLEKRRAAIAEWLERFKACVGADGGHFK
jgi:hypothetical protein